MTSAPTTPDTFTFAVSDRAVETIRDMHHHVEKLGQAFGKDSPEYREALESLAKQLAHLLTHPMRQTTTVGRDGDLSLICSADSFVFGLIFHRTRRICTDPECHAWINDDGGAWRYNDPPKDHNHTPSYPLDAPHPGTWSFHS